jgi:DNA-binding MarR family transcriptional regulator
MKRVIGKGPSLMAPVEVVQVKEEDPQTKAFAELETLFSAAASIDAIKIFFSAKDGIKSSTQAIRELDLTQKRYYTNLKRLIDAGLVERVEGAYRHTTLGKIGFKLTETLMIAVGQKDRLDLVDRLSKAKNITVDETQEIMRAILKDTHIVPGDRITDLLGPIRMADTWDKLVRDVIEYIDNSKEEISFASQYLDMGVVESIFRAAQRNVRMKFLVGEEKNITNAIQLLLKTLLTDPETLKFLFRFVKSSELQIRRVDLPYTFIVVDGKYSMVEVTKPYTKSFSLAFFFHSEKLSQMLKESFDKLWENGNEVPFT